VPEPTVSSAVRVFISYARDDRKHARRVRRFWKFLREVGIDARLDAPAGEEPQDWPIWMRREIRAARYVLVIASPQYRLRAEGDVPPDVGRGVQWEARQLRDEMYEDHVAARLRLLPVVLPGCSADDIPDWMGRYSATHYTVAKYTVSGAEKLLRYVTGQPYETTPALGPGLVLPPRDGGAPDEPAETAGLGVIFRRLIDRDSPRNESLVQSDVRQFLLVADLGLDERDLGAEPDRQNLIGIDAGLAVVEVRADLRKPEVRGIAERQLAAYLAPDAGRRYVGILTDGAEWHLYRSTDARLLEVKSLLAATVEDLVSWLESVLATRQGIRPSPQEIRLKLGAESPAHALDNAELAAIYDRHRDLPVVRVKRGLWAKLLTTAAGTNFTDEDALFVDHTLLVAMAEIIGHAVIGIRPDDPTVGAAALMSGELFTRSQIGGVIEADFFDWIAEVPEGERFVKNLARRLTRFAWDEVEHDVMKVLYESIISPQTRHRLGEYYTPDWLAEEIIAECVTDPLGQRVLDASCGSGTFLFHAVRGYLAAAEAAGITGAAAIPGLVAHVMGIDVHPVAVTLARVTYLLAIGLSRVRADDRTPFAVPVYLGDSLRWGHETTMFTYDGLSVATATDHQMFVDQSDGSGQLNFPERVVADADKFDRLVNDFASRATRRAPRSAVPSVDAILELFAVHNEDRQVLRETFRTICELHDEGRDHIWGYYVRNVARPAWLARPDNRVDVLVGNPPWLAFRYMTDVQQVSFRAMSTERNLWAGAMVATHQDLSALFVARCVELYLRPGGRFGFVMPLATLSRRQYAGFRAGNYPVSSQPVRVMFDRPWDLHRIKPAFFPVPASVVFGRRSEAQESATPLRGVADIWSGRFATATASRAEAAPHATRTRDESGPEPTLRASPYFMRFAQGAAVVPRFLFIVEPDDAGPLGVGAGRRAVQSLRSANEKMPWKGLATLHGTIERRFLRRIYLGSSILPFRPLPPPLALVPWDGERLLHAADERLDRHPGLAEWWRAAELLWDRYRSSDRLSLIEQLDYRGKLSQQFPPATCRVVYTKSGMYLAAASVVDAEAIIDQQLYWGSITDLSEARYLTAILNSSVLTMAVRPLQSRGEYNPRHFDKLVFQLPIPLYDAADSAHQWLVALAERAEEVAAGVELRVERFETQRRRIREALAANGVAADIDAIVKPLLA
jgi:hypothetical protein